MSIDKRSICPVCDVENTTTLDWYSRTIPYRAICHKCENRYLVHPQKTKPEKETSDSEATPINITVNTGDTVPLSLYRECDNRLIGLRNRYRDLQEAHIKLKKELAMFEQANNKLKRDIFLLQSGQEI